MPTDGISAASGGRRVRYVTVFGQLTHGQRTRQNPLVFGFDARFIQVCSACD
jgi:hypothetical protein